jgi:hypothetical protein
MRLCPARTHLSSDVEKSVEKASMVCPILAPTSKITGDELGKSFHVEVGILPNVELANVVSHAPDQRPQNFRCGMHLNRFFECEPLRAARLNEPALLCTRQPSQRGGRCSRAS